MRRWKAVSILPRQPRPAKAPWGQDRVTLDAHDAHDTHLILGPAEHAVVTTWPAPGRPV